MATIQEYMETLRQYDYVAAIIIVIAAYIIGQLVKLSIRKVAKRLTRKTKTSLDDEILRALEKPILYVITFVGIIVALLTLSLLSSYNDKIIVLARIGGIIIGCWAVIRIVAGLFRWYAKEIAAKTKSNMDDKYLHIFRRVVNMIIIAVVGMLLLQQLGVQITPLIASLGIGGLAIALALQDTLANFFSGFYIISDRAVEIGDYIEIEAPGGTIKGTVEDIGWRTSKITTLTGNHVIVPNSSFANSVVINYHAPSSEMSLIVNIGVSYASDLEKVEKVTCAAIKDTLQNVEGCVKDFEPVVRFREFADSAITLIAILRIIEPTKQGIIKHEFVKRLHKMYNKEGIDIPFPIRTVYMHKTDA